MVGGTWIEHVTPTMSTSSTLAIVVENQRRSHSIGPVRQRSNTIITGHFVGRE